MSGVSIPEALRKNLRPRRSIAGSARPKTAAQVEKWVAKTFASKPHSYMPKTNAQLFEAGLESKNEETLASARREAYELLSKLDAASVKAASIEALSVAERMVWHMSHEASLAPVIAAARGLPDAVEAVVRATRLQTATLDGYTTSVLVVPASAQGRTWGEPCRPLRHLICAAPDAEYVEARRHAEALRKDADLMLRSSIAYVFPEEPWGNADLESALESEAKPEAYHFVLTAVSDASLVQRWVAAKGPFHLATYALDLVCALPPAEAVALFGEHLPKLLVKPKHGPLLKTPPRDVAQALACIGTKAAAATLAAYANHAVLAPMVLAFFRERPELGSALQAQAKGKGKLEATAARVLGKPRPAAAEATAEPGDLPPVLRDAPWRASKRGGKETIVAGLSLLGLELERVALVRQPSSIERSRPVRDMSSEAFAAWKATASEGDFVYADYEHAKGAGGAWEYHRIPDEEGLWSWNEKPKAYLAAGPLAWVEKHGLATIPGFLAREWIRWLAYDGHEEYLDAVMSLVSPRSAPMLARVATRKRWRRVAAAWLVEHAEVAAFGLIPDALSDKKEARAHAEAALLLIARHGKDAVVRTTASKYGEEAARAIEALLARDPLAVDVTVPKRPDFLRLGELPRVSLRSGKSLDEDAISLLVEMLQISAVDEPYPGIELVREACDEASLGELAIELVEQWVIGDAPGRHEWMLHAAVHFRSERGIRRVAELAREWARKNMAKAERACAALAADGSDIALVHLAHIAETTRFAALKETAASLIRDAAAARGLTEAELGDRTVPDGGLGPDGTITVSYGTRELVVGCDVSLGPVVREKTNAGLGSPAKTLPRPVKTDDAAKVKQARERFEQLKQDLAAIGQRQMRRLERAMIEGRTWPVPDFEARIVAHPLLRHIAAALIWEVVPAEGEAQTFRIAEDGTPADASDRRLELSEEAGVRLAHPARTPGLAGRWSALFGDYEIVQPFEQLGRAVHAPTPAEEEADRIDRTGAIAVPARKLLGTMEARGWRRDDAGFVSAFLRPVRGRHGEDLTARWAIVPGISMESLPDAPDAVTSPLVVEGPDGAPVSLGAVEVVGFSEIVRDVEAVRAL
ncbi:MAG: hypothetical protein BGO98_12150 [Myxococcales bacterium 68-20]|nr:MAG: hypothetical protein BGO98_12150 [Myxococcales bacterium 68-20]